jgi:hypothetical protein
MRAIRFLVPLAVAAAAIALLPLAATGGTDDRLFIGITLHFTGPTTTAGTFVMSGEVEDSGASTVAHLSVVPIGNSDMGRLSGDQAYVGQKGTIFTHFEGHAFPLTSPHQVGKGRIDIVGGTGAYAGIGGNATFLIVVDQTTNRLIGTASGNVTGY